MDDCLFSYLFVGLMLIVGLVLLIVGWGGFVTCDGCYLVVGIVVWV